MNDRLVETIGARSESVEIYVESYVGYYLLIGILISVAVETVVPLETLLQMTSGNPFSIRPRGQ